MKGTKQIKHINIVWKVPIINQTVFYFIHVIDTILPHNKRQSSYAYDNCPLLYDKQYYISNKSGVQSIWWLPFVMRQDGIYYMDKVEDCLIYNRKRTWKGRTIWQLFRSSMCRRRFRPKTERSMLKGCITEYWSWRHLWNHRNVRCREKYSGTMYQSYRSADIVNGCGTG